MRRPVIATFVIALLLVLTQAVGASAQLCAPREGVELPADARSILLEDPQAYSFGRAWTGVTERAAAVRAAVAEGALARGSAAVQGNFQIPVFAVRFADTVGEPWLPADLETRLFDGQGASLTDFYTEISRGAVDVGGQVLGWTTLAQDASHYAGTSNGTNPANAKIGELILETITAHDATIDFGQFDNDGPDGIPNSGDDDGYVDFVAFVHPESGGECGGNDNIWSHRWRYPAWSVSNGFPLQTNDAAAGGGTIKIDDYVIQPGLACNGTDMIEIGVFCHEFGHAFGLPDLYDVNGGGANGLGHWCLMASGNWNSPSSPAHMSAWTASKLGWVDVVDVGPEPVAALVTPVFESGTVYRLPFDDDRWKVRTDCAIQGNASMAVGLTAAESAARGWVQPEGYGNGWVETVAHDFHFDGNGPVFLSYDYAITTEAGFDFVFVVIEIDGVESNLRVHDGSGSGTEMLDLTPYLPGVPTDYRVKFRFRSDSAWSNEDGSFAAACAAFAFDDLTLAGGGEQYAADFEEHRGGWYAPRNAKDNPVTEYWLVENRRRRGFDQHLRGEGLLIYHVDDEVMNTMFGNSGGYDDGAARGVVVEEADGLFNLLAEGPANRGDAGDVWPGLSTGRFDASSAPSTISNEGEATEVAILSMAASGDDVQVVWRAGNPAPVFTGTSPITAETGAPVQVTIEGASNVQYGATVRMVRFGQPALEAVAVEWLDFDRVSATFQAQAADAGTWDVVVENPDGQNALVAAAFEWTEAATSTPDLARVPTVFELERNVPNPFNPRTRIRFSVPRAAHVDLRVFDARGREVRSLVGTALDAGFHEVTWEGDDASGHDVGSGVYFARMRADDFVATQKMLLAQ